MKFRLWHVILREIANMSPGQKNLESCQKNVLEQSLSSPLAFPILAKKSNDLSLYDIKKRNNSENVQLQTLDAHL